MTNAVSLAQYGSTGVSQGFKNRIINGAMVIDQRNNGAVITTGSGFPVDRFQLASSQASKFSAQQNAGSVTPPAGFTNYLGITSSSAYSVISSDFFLVYQPIEGYTIADLNFGSANAKTVTLSFWVRSSLTGTFGGAFNNYTGSRAYPFSYTISSANTWEYKTITVVGDTSGTWVGASNAGAAYLAFSLGAGSNRTGTAGAWVTPSGDTPFTPSGATSVVGTNGATWYITGVQLEVGSTATSFDYRPYGTELQLCQRYFQQIKTLSTDGTIAPAGTTTTTSAAAFFYPYIVPPRVAATGINVSSAGDYGGVTLGSNNATCSTIVFAGAGTYSVRINATFSGAPFSASVPQPCFLYTINNGYIQFTGMEL